MEQKLCNLLTRLLSLPKENEWVEFKQNFHGEDEIGVLISALANTANLWNEPFGYLVFGIKDATKEVLGTTFKPSQKMIGNNELENWLIQNLTPHIDFRIHEFNFEGKSIALFKIPAALNQPVVYKKISYVRIGTITRRLADFPAKERKIWNKNTQVFEKSIALQGCTADDVIKLLDTQTFFDLLNLPYPTTQQGVIEKFRAEALIEETADGYAITNLGAILLAKNLHDFPSLERKIVRINQYKGTNKLDTIIDEEFPQGYAVGFTAIVKRVNNLLPQNEEIGMALRKDVRMYPQLAIRELVANSIIHQDFTITGTATMIEIYSDRIEFTNAGKPLIETVRFIDEYCSRNEKLAALMRRMKICEEKGSGIDKVIVQCELYQLPAPNFVSTEIHTKVILYAYKQLRNMDKAEKVRAVYQHACLKWVSNDFMTNQSLRDRFKIDPHNYAIASRLIRDALSERMIVEADAESKSKKFAKYLPYWA